MYDSKSIYTKLALETIVEYVKNGSVKKSKSEEIPNKLKEKKACFVSLHKNENLRGCIGTILPYRENLYEEIQGNAIAAASQDPRFDPVREDELDELTLSVDILSVPELIDNIDELDEKKYGVIVEKNGRKGLLLPNLEGVKDVDEQLEIAKSKAGIYDDKGMKIYKFTSTRYY